jgi:uncharacterized protein YxjI
MKSKFYKLKEDFWIKNEKEKECFFVDIKRLSMGLQFEILKNNNALYSVKQKVLSFMGSYEIFENGDTISQVSQKLTLSKDKLKIDGKYGDIKITGDMFHFNYSIVKDDKVIGRVTRRLVEFKEEYAVNINFEDEAFILTLVIIIDDIVGKQLK